MSEPAETEERAFYADRASSEWLEALAPLGTDDVKTHLTDAPWILVLPVGWPAENAIVPDIARRPLDDVLVRVPPT